MLFRLRYDLDTGRDFIVDQLHGPGEDHSHRWIYTKCKQHSISTGKEDVRILLSLLDPIGSQVHQTRRLRRRQYFAQGPNFVWHIRQTKAIMGYALMAASTGSHATSFGCGPPSLIATQMLSMEAAPGSYKLTWALRTWWSETFSGIYGETTWMTEQRRGATSQGQVPRTRELRAGGE